MWYMVWDSTENKGFKRIQDRVGDRVRERVLTCIQQILLITPIRTRPRYMLEVGEGAVRCVCVCTPITDNSIVFPPIIDPIIVCV